MIDFIQKLEEILKREFLITAQGGAYYLTEENEPNYPSTLIKKRETMLLYSFDVVNSNQAIFPIYNDNVPSLTSIADYLIFYPKTDKLFVFICNLKSKNISNANKQAEASWQLAEYIVNTTKRMLNFKEIQVEYRSLLFCQGNTSRFTTNAKKLVYETLGKSGLKNLRLEAGLDCYLDLYCV